MVDGEKAKGEMLLFHKNILLVEKDNWKIV
jgi:hypothetical protein